MSRCACTSRALELFIKDVAGLHIRRSAPRVPPRSQQYRNFSSAPRRRQLDTAIDSVGAQDGFIPFDFDKYPGRSVEGAGDEGREKNAAEAVVESEEQAVDAEWHAEIEIQGVWPARTSATEGVFDTNVREVEELEGIPLKEDWSHEREGEMTVAGVPLHGLRVPTSSNGRVFAAAAEPPSPSKMASVNGSGRSKAENRLLRKQRRVIQGTWGPKRAERMQSVVEETQEDDGVDSVLSRIEAMKGPSVQDKNARYGKEKKEAEARPRNTENQRAQAEARFQKSDKKATKANPQPPKTESKGEREPWQIQKSALANKFGTVGWQPHKKLSPDTISGIKALHASDPASYSTATLSQHFEVSPEAIRRILRSKWRPSEEVAEERRVRWEKRGVRKWGELAGKGVRPPKKWREAGVQWEDKGKGKAKEGRVGRRRREALGEDQVVGMLTGIGEKGLDERIL